LKANTQFAYKFCILLSFLCFGCSAIHKCYVLAAFQAVGYEMQHILKYVHKEKLFSSPTVTSVDIENGNRYSFLFQFQMVNHWPRLRWNLSLDFTAASEVS